MWSFGILLEELALGRAPMANLSLTSVIMSTLARRPPAPPARPRLAGPRLAGPRLARRASPMRSSLRCGSAVPGGADAKRAQSGGAYAGLVARGTGHFFL